MSHIGCFVGFLWLVLEQIHYIDVAAMLAMGRTVSPASHFRPYHKSWSDSQGELRRAVNSLVEQGLLDRDQCVSCP